MRMLGLRAATVAFLLVPTMANAQEYPLAKDYSGNYLCKMTAGAGIRLDEASSKWVSTTFNIENSSYIVRVIDTGETDRGETDNGEISRIYNITVKDFDRKGEAFPCFSGLQTNRKERKKIELSNGFTSCVFIGNSYQFDFETLKIQQTFDGGYMDNEVNTDTPAVFVGKCQRID